MKGEGREEKRAEGKRGRKEGKRERGRKKKK